MVTSPARRTGSANCKFLKRPTTPHTSVFESEGRSASEGRASKRGRLYAEVREVQSLILMKRVACVGITEEGNVTEHKVCIKYNVYFNWGIGVQQGYRDKVGRITEDRLGLFLKRFRYFGPPTLHPPLPLEENTPELWIYLGNAVRDYRK